MIKKALVTGAGGFIGAKMVTFLKSRGFSVVVVKKRDLRLINNIKPLLKDVDIVFHFAADMGGVGYFSEANYYPFINNMLIDLNLLVACEEMSVKRVFYPSSACIYPPSKRPLSEDMINLPADPDQMYGWEKLSITKLVKHSPLDVRVGILHTIFGPGQSWEGKKAKFPPTIAFKAIQAKDTGKIYIWGDGSQTRTFLYIDDAIEMIYEVATSERYEGPVNISSNEVVTVKQCAKWACDYLEISPKFIYQPDKPTGVMTRGVDNSKYEKIYKYRQKIKTQKGFELITDYIRSNYHLK